MTTSTAFINYINTGTGVNSGDGDSLRTAFNKINLNFKNILNSFVAAGVASFNSQTGIITFTGTDIINQLGYIPYPTSNPLGFITNDTANLQNYATITYVNDNFVSELDLSAYNFASVNYVDAKLTEYPSLTYLNNQGFLVPATLPDFLTAYSTQTDLANLTTSFQSFTTSSIFEAVNNSSIIPSVADTYDLGEESYRWGTLYLSNAAYIKGIGITIDPITSRLIVDGNSVTGAFRFSPSAIYNEAGIGFSISSTAPDPLAAQQKVRIYVPTDTDGDTIPLDVTNTGTSGLLLQGHTKSISINENGISFTGSLSSSLTLNQTSGQFLKIGKKADVYVASTGTFTTYTNTAEISAYNTSSNSALVLSGSRVVLHASTASTHNQYVQTAYVSLDETGLYIGRTRTNGYGAISDPNVFEGLRIPLGKGAPGDILIITTGTNNINNVAYITPQLSPYPGIFTVTNTTSAFSTNSGALRVAGGVGVGGDLYAGNIYSNGVQLTLGGLAGGSLTSVGSHILPSANLTYDLGSTSSQWRSLYVGTSTIYLGGTALSVSGGSLTVDGSPVTGGGGGVATTSTLVNGTYTVSLSTTGNLTLTASGIITAPNNEFFKLQARAADSVLRNEINLDPNNGTYMSVWSDGETSFSFNDWATGSWNNESGLGAARFTDAQVLQDFWTTGPGSLGLAYEVSINGGPRTPNVFYDGNNGETYGVFLGLDAVPPGGQGTTVPITSLVFYYQTQSKINMDVDGGEILLDGQALNINLQTTNGLNLQSGQGLDIKNIGQQPVRIFTDNTTHVWEFDSGGSLTLPREGRITGIGDGGPGGDRYGYISWDGNSSGDGSGFNTMRLVPDLLGLEDLDQYIIIDPTGGVPGHIHIRAGGTQDNSLADLYLGGENSHVKISAGANPPVTIMANSSTWIFGTDGVITLPGSGSVDGSDYDVEIIAGNDGSSTYGHVTLKTNGPNGVNEFYMNSLGELTLPRGGVIQETEVTNELWGTTTTSLTLVPAGADNGTQRLEIYATGGGEGDHIHITSGDQTQTDLFLGNDTQFFAVGAMGQIEVRARDGLDSPTTGTSAYAGSPVWIYAGNAGDNGGDQADGALGGDILLEAGTSTIGPVGLGGSVYLKSGNGIEGFGSVKLSTDGGSSYWNFDKDNQIVFPDGTTQTTAWLAGTVSSVQTNSLSSFIPETGTFTNTNQLTVSHQAHAADYGFNFTIDYQSPLDETKGVTVGAINTPLIVSTSSVKVRSNLSTSTEWTFGTDGSLTVPGSIIPDADVAYDLGSPTNRFRDIYVSSSTIYLGTSTISISSEGQMLVNGATADAKFEYFGGEGYGPRDAAYIAWNTSTITFNIPQPELLRAIYDLKPGSQFNGKNFSTNFDKTFTITGVPREYIRSGGYNMADITVAETTGTNQYIHHLYLPVKDKSAVLANGTWTVAVNTTGTIVFPNGTIQTGAAISIAELKVLVAASTDFADFKSRIAAL